MVTENNFTPINWKNISQIIDFYEKFNKAKYIDTPWIVPSEIKEITYTGPDENVLISTRACLVGSAEQGFIHCQVNDVLENGQLYISCSPCFRNEKELNNLHRPYFVKAEFFIPIRISASINLVLDEFADIIDFAKSAFYSISDNMPNQVKTGDFSADLMLNGIEIGSYYFRCFVYNNIRYSYICGTAIAEPRFSIANGRS